MICVGFRGYVETPKGLRALTTVFAGHISDECKRRFYKKFYKSKKRAYSKYQARWAEVVKEGGKPMEAEIERTKKFCQVVRAICHTQVGKLHLRNKKAHIKEIQ